MFEKIKKILFKEFQIKTRNNEKKELEDDEREAFFKTFLMDNSTKSSTFMSMFMVYNNLDQELSGLIIKNDLMIMFDYLEEDEYYEVMIESKQEARKKFYITIGTEGGEDTVTLESLDDYLDVAALTPNEILDILKKEIMEFYK